MLSNILKLRQSKFLIVGIVSLLLNASPAYSAGINFVPAGAQIDNDPIFDIPRVRNQATSFSIFFNTNGLAANLRTLTYDILYDPNELQLVNFIIGGQNNFRINRSPAAILGVIQVTHDLGNVPINRNFFIDRINFTTTQFLVNNGTEDFSINLTRAVDVNNVNVFNAFVPRRQNVEVQPVAQLLVPEPVTILGSGVALGIGAIMKRRYSKKKAEQLG
ncbi:PEP-CTERM sorting domain-containing protein [Nostoc sp. CHAB 5844]|nr:PEP-CTERM sorting domain-containing protein [Nostoc sp. CHAB 5844]